MERIEANGVAPNTALVGSMSIYAKSWFRLHRVACLEGANSRQICRSRTTVSRPLARGTRALSQEANMIKQGLAAACASERRNRERTGGGNGQSAFAN